MAQLLEQFTGWREVLVSMANQGLFNHHADLQTAVLLCESAANASPEDLEKAVKQAQSLEASKSLSKIVKAGPWATHIFEKMHACGATQKLQQAHSGSYPLWGRLLRNHHGQFRRARHLPDLGGCG